MKDPHQLAADAARAAGAAQVTMEAWARHIFHHPEDDPEGNVLQTLVMVHARLHQQAALAASQLFDPRPLRRGEQN